ncbi:major facilitator superfamily domain-containing protein [Xylariales sp. PMI_506]|nr:major facilitator superfamily domain-containing protein [Xylariales sp. PMI_506]
MLDPRVTSPAKRHLSVAVEKLFWVPSHLRWDPQLENELTWTQTIIYSLAAAVSGANMYYSQPILNILASDFGVSDERASLIPTISQAGYACGLLLIVPVGDIVKRRPMIMLLMLFTALLWLGITLIDSFSTFLGLSFLVGMLNITPQLIFPLAIQYTPQKHRATSTAVVLSGMTVGVLVARLLSGIVTQYTSWRNVYWLSLGLQLLTALLLFVTLPDYPILQPETNYPGILLKIIVYPFRYPLLTQQSLIIFLLSSMFASFWSTLTFQLVGQFNLSTLVVGLFALIGIVAAVLSPLVVGLLSPRLHPSGMSIIGHVVGLVAACIGTFVGTISLAGPVLWAALGDLGLDIIIVGTRLAIGDVDPKGQNVVNSVYMIFVYCGQLTGTAVGNRLYAEGGWLYSGAFGIVTIGLSLGLVFLRGPYEDSKSWVGWKGGWNMNVKLVTGTLSPATISEQEVKQALESITTQDEGKIAETTKPDEE